MRFRQIKLKKVSKIVLLSIAVLALAAAFILSSVHSKKAIAAVTCDGSTCTATGAVTLNDGDLTFDNTNFIIAPGSTVTIYGHHDFANLTIQNTGILTHAAIVDADIDSTDGDIMSSGQPKKVDITVAGTLSLEGSGKIDVTGKGFPGGSGYAVSGGLWTDITHFGRSTVTDDMRLTIPGDRGGRSAWDFDDGCDGRFYGGGGGHGGQGRVLTWTSGSGRPDASYPILPYEPTYGNREIPGEYGAGGAGNFEDYSTTFTCSKHSGYGGAGGGIIKISAGKIEMSASSSIISNGNNGGGDAGGGGGGGGGSIYITTSILDNENVGNPSVDPGSVGDGAAAGTLWNALTKAENLEGFGGNIQAKGGRDGGGGGRIAIKTTGEITIQKRLIAVSRAGAVNTSFNPYALQIGDRIEVEITASNIILAVDIEDEFLHNYDSSVKCIPDGLGDVNTMADRGLTATLSDNTVHWTGDMSNPSPNFSGEKFIYYCTVSNVE